MIDLSEGKAVLYMSGTAFTHIHISFPAPVCAPLKTRFNPHVQGAPLPATFCNGGVDSDTLQMSFSLLNY